jgi:hypothetical protein
MRTFPLATLSVLIAVIAAAFVMRVPENVAVAMVVAPLVVAVVTGLLFFTKADGWRRSHGLKEWLVYGPVQADLDKLPSRVARIPAVILCLLLSVGLGAIAGMIIGGAA